MAVGQPYDGVIDANNTFPAVLAACPNFQTAAVAHNPYLPAMGATQPPGSSICPNGLRSAGGTYSPPLGDGIVYHATAGSIGGVVYLPYCSPGSIALGPTDIPGGYDGKGAGDVGSLTASSTRRTSTFANIFLGCNPFYNGNVGTGQGQLTVNIQENYSLVLSALSATSNPAMAARRASLESGAGRCPSRRRYRSRPIRSGPVRSMTLSCRVLIPRSTRFRCSPTTTTTSTRPTPRAASPSTLRCRRPMAVAPAAGRTRSCRRTPRVVRCARLRPARSSPGTRSWPAPSMAPITSTPRPTSMALRKRGSTSRTSPRIRIGGLRSADGAGSDANINPTPEHHLIVQASLPGDR